MMMEFIQENVDMGYETLDRKDSPWYPNLTLYRQKQIDNWTHVFDKIQMDLQSLIKEKGIQ